MEWEKALNLLLKYNREKFHVQHALTVGAVMKWYAKQFGYDENFWSIVGLLHDLDFEQYPEQHCIKAAEILKEEGYAEEVIYAVCSHGYGVMVDVKPKHEMEKILFATDELTGLIGAAALMRPSKSVADMELKSVKKKFKDKAFAAGCSRDIIATGAEMLGWDLDKLLGTTLEAMQATESAVAEGLGSIFADS
jgi:putative nucleotidyltransferase with HDIG domain